MTFHGLCLIAVLVGLPTISAELTKRGALSYVVQRGCPYMAHYVRENYYDYARARRQATPTTPTPEPHLNWVTYLYQHLSRDYVPVELFKGLVNCGKEYAMFAIKAPANVTALLNVEYHSVPGLG